GPDRAGWRCGGLHGRRRGRLGDRGRVEAASRAERVTRHEGGSATGTEAWTRLGGRLHDRMMPLDVSKRKWPWLATRDGRAAAERGLSISPTVRLARVRRA